MATPQPHAGIPVKAPLVPPIAGQVVVGYQIIEPETGCCKCDDLTGGGLFLLIIGILIFWPIALIPCFSSDCKKKSQVPVYGYPGAAPQAVPGAQPIYHGQPPYPPQQQSYGTEAQQPAYPPQNSAYPPPPTAYPPPAPGYPANKV